MLLKKAYFKIKIKNFFTLKKYVKKNSAEYALNEFCREFFTMATIKNIFVRIRIFIS